MIYKVGQKVITLDDEQGFISQIYDCGSFDVDILDDNGIDAVTVGFDANDYVKLASHQIPELNEICPLGVVMGVHRMRKGIINVHTCNSLAYAGLWLSWDRVEYLNGYGNIELPYGCWLDCESSDFDDVLTVFDMQEVDGLIVNAPLFHHDIAEQCIITVLLSDNNIERWRAGVNGDSQITSVQTPIGEVKSLGEFRDACLQLGVVDATLNSEYSIKSF